MRTLKYMLFSVFVLTLITNCSKDDDRNGPELTGTWVELTSQSDSIDFDHWETEDIFMLRRGFELVDGNWLPRQGSSMYRYTLRKDSMLINNMLWSCMCYPSYYFKMNSTRTAFEIGNFYDTSMVESRRITFVRIK